MVKPPFYTNRIVADREGQGVRIDYIRAYQPINGY